MVTLPRLHLYHYPANTLFLIRITQSLASQSVTVSGTTGAGSKHSHTRGTMDIKGSLNNSSSDECFYKNAATGSGCIIAKNASSSHRGTNSNSGTTTRGFEFQASKNWSGSTSEENSHTHSFSSSATIGSGSYTRPNSTSTLIIIRY